MASERHVLDFPLPTAPGHEHSAVRLCIVDLGTNSFHAAIVDAYAHRSFDVLDKVKEVVHLGSGGNVLTEEAVERATRALERIRLVAEGWQVHEYRAYATSAIREAENGGAFVEHVRRRVGIHVRPIEGEREARLIYEGVRRAVSLEQPALVVDIGGGSTELIIGDAEAQSRAASFKVGAARMTSRFVTTDPVEADELDALRAHLLIQLKPILDQAKAEGVVDVVGSSGTMENLASVCAKAHGDGDRPIFEQVFGADAFVDTCRKIVKSDRSDREDTKDIDEKRVDQIVAGAVLAELIVTELGAERVRVSPAALREGMIVDYIDQNFSRLERLAPAGDVRSREVEEMLVRFGTEEMHARHVEALAVGLFDATRTLHELGGRERDLLAFAARLHDIGYAISRRRHHEHGRYLIQEADWNGFTTEEVAIMANVVRYHRRAFPKKKHEAYAELPKPARKVVKKLGALLRLAEGLDRSHYQNVRRMEVAVNPDSLELVLHTRGDPEMDVWGARRGAVLFEKEFDREVEVQAAWAPRGERPAAPPTAA
jgi:exopolyphosphatase/guanosine-5'-triphosphate,3'-diphosphate pyrophosphatase